MRQVLLLFVFLVSAFALHAQTVLVKDSTVTSYDGIHYFISDVTKYLHDDSCRIKEGKTHIDHYFLFYNSDGLVYEQLNQVYDDVYGRFRNSSRQTYTYTEAKKLSTILDETRIGFYTYTWVKRSVDSFTYDRNNYLVRAVYAAFDLYADTINYYSQTRIYNDKFGRVDSAIVIVRGQADSSIYYYTYYGTTTNFQHLIKVSSVDRDRIISRSDFFYDSSDYIKTDSVAYKEIDTITNSLKLIDIGVQKYFYHHDGSVKEWDRYSKYIPYSQKSFEKTFYTYERCSLGIPLALHAERQNNNALLNWQTEADTKASGYILQRSTDGEHFTSINNVSASANNVNENYTYTDANALLLNVPKLYYRLAKTSEDGAVIYSKIAILDVAATKVLVTLSPNPVANVLHLYSAQNIGVASVTVTDMKGRMVCSTSANMMAGGQTNINVSALAKGLYVVTLQTANLKQQFKVIKE